MIVTVKHTSIPWKADRELILDSTSKEIARTNYKTRIEAYANAAFIVRACNNHDELLAACKRALAALDADYFNEPEGCGCEVCEVMRDAHTAIRKAEEE